MVIFPFNTVLSRIFSRRLSSYISLLFMVCTLLAVAATVTGCAGSSVSSVKSDTFAYLEKVRTERKQLLVNRLDKLMGKVRHAENDGELIDSFKQLGGSGRRTVSTKHALRQAIDKLDLHFVLQYGDFYDLLFIKKGGYVFHSINMESDFHSNLFTGHLSKTKLSRALQQTKVPRFVDYDYYIPSAEPASFFIAPIKSDNQDLGWIAFQIPINIINNIMSNSDGLGRTGESYLTNAHKLMLTQSRLLQQETILKMPINTDATNIAIQDGSGNLLINDYRKVRVYSSFEKMYFQNVVWVLIVEMDEDEVITDKFRQTPEYYMEKVFKQITPGQNLTSRHSYSDGKAFRIDMNEYLRGEPGELLWTKGVATCTGVAITYQDRFSYLGHVNPLDDVYFSPVKKMSLSFGHWIKGIDVQSNSSNLLGKMMGDITQFDVTKAKLRNLKIVLVAVHTNSFERIVTSLLDQGIYLSQIKILHTKDMEYANISVGGRDGYLSVEWGGAKKNMLLTNDKGTQNLGEIVKSILYSDA